ncbi:histidine--tRNA ligase [Mesosutterella sp. OilRF-GAM-744-9]|uniref:Histidine--tRNA ligase n=1 Tax=Mesosutterella porci TaxID=2915351 RepID=A0ABS9MT65_9BURK|nr:histidine--tRNA ligase [Mesosutterella sp. oilRF-744-WT-GAM-9]MCG5031818.1 histidine--tRNA ligase [Mesosutterella sp. oilRF-744-WT-GAM-9]
MASKAKIKAVTGMNDMLPGDSAIWTFFEDTVRDVATSYGYRPMRTPVLEPTALFTHGIGEATDVVEKEMYSFEDSLNGEKLSLRPENTAGIVRAAIEHNLLYDAPRRVWYFGPMFRHERPQRGRYRQFYQFGCEALGFAGPDVDAELILMTSRLWKELGIREVKLELNTLGEPAERAAHREALIKYFEAHLDALNETARHRLYLNPLRILDTKDPDMQQLVEAAPRLIDYLGEGSRAFLASLERQLERAGVDYVINPRLVRGLDYYSHTVFEWTTDRLGSQATICGGGRYDGLMEILGGKPAPCVGFAMGAERVLELMKEFGVHPTEPDCTVYVVHCGEGTLDPAVEVAEELRDLGVATIVHGGEASMKSQMKKADASGALFALIVGESEAAAGQVSIKPLRELPEKTAFSGQKTVPAEEAARMIFDEILVIDTKDL